MLVTGIKSKPVYAPLEADTVGRYHLMLGHGVGCAPLHRVLEEIARADQPALARTRVLFVAEAAAGDGHAERFAAAVSDVRVFKGIPDLLVDFREILTDSLMGTRLYVAGPESFIGLAMKIALEFNLNKDEIRAEECGTLGRRVYCIHCRATTEGVRTNVARCVDCGRHLIVRDHYSRRFAGKTDFRGAEQHYKLRGKERFRIFGLAVEGQVATDLGDTVYAGDKKVGVITCGMYSSLTRKSMAIARLDAPVAVHGTRLEIRGKRVNGPATAHTLPFDDVEKKKRTAVG